MKSHSKLSLARRRIAKKIQNFLRTKPRKWIPAPLPATSRALVPDVGLFALRSKYASLELTISREPGIRYIGTSWCKHTFPSLHILKVKRWRPVLRIISPGGARMKTKRKISSSSLVLVLSVLRCKLVQSLHHFPLKHFSGQLVAVLHNGQSSR